MGVGHFKKGNQNKRVERISITHSLAQKKKKKKNFKPKYTNIQTKKKSKK